MKSRIFYIPMSCCLFIVFTLLLSCSGTRNNIKPEEARAIAKEAYIYGFPVVDNYRIIYSYFIDQNDPEFKAPINNLKNIARVFTPEDKVMQTPNSDTPYSMLEMDLRSEPFVLTVPAIENNRYFSIQLIDAYTFNFDYIGSRTTGNDGGSYLIAGPSWKGETPAGIKKVFRSETEFVYALYRTQLFNSADLDNVKKIQKGYKVQTLSEFLGKPSPTLAPKIDFFKAISLEDQKKSLTFFDELNFCLQFCPTHPSEKEIIARFSKIGIGTGLNFDQNNLSPELKKAIEEGIQDAWKELEECRKENLATGKVTSGDIFGTREYLKNNYMYRFTADVLGIYGNSKEEAIYLDLRIDTKGQFLDGSKHRYSLHFADGQLPPVNAFWSLTMYELPASLLVANPISRYLINSPMLPALKKDADGGITILIQYASPGKNRESNWLPAPNGPFLVLLRLYWPKEEAFNGIWKKPPMEIVQ